MEKECLSFFILKDIRGTANQNETMYIVFIEKGWIEMKAISKTFCAFPVGWSGLGSKSSDIFFGLNLPSPHMWKDIYKSYLLCNMYMRA